MSQQLIKQVDTIDITHRIKKNTAA